MNKKILLVVGLVVTILLAGAGGFWGGMIYKGNQESQAQALFFEQRGGQPQAGQFPDGGQFPQGTPFPGGAPGAFSLDQGIARGGGTMGQVKEIEGNVLTISTAQDVKTINLLDNTTIIKSVEGSANDLQPGTRVMVIGDAGEDGRINASQITIIDNATIITPAQTAP